MPIAPETSHVHSNSGTTIFLCLQRAVWDKLILTVVNGSRRVEHVRRHAVILPAHGDH